MARDETPAWVITGRATGSGRGRDSRGQATRGGEGPESRKRT